MLWLRVGRIILAWSCVVVGRVAASVGTSNPFLQGCLYNKNRTGKIRVCNSEDPPDAATKGWCRLPPSEYEEIRLFAGDWHSSMLAVWILQIILSEILNVPTSIEMGDPLRKLNFYHPDSPFDVPATANDAMYFEGVENAYNWNGECTRADRSPHHHYQPCFHVEPESWHFDTSIMQDYVNQGFLEPPKSLAFLGQEGLFVPRFTAESDPSLLSYLGLQGEANRKKLARKFRRPTTWNEYCTQVSTNGCQSPDLVAQRAPRTPLEYDRMFVEGIFTGYFRDTPQNNCTANPSTCKGSISDYPCEWSSPVESQLYHLNIGLDTGLMEHGGRSYDQLVEIWRAANATKSDVILYSWSPNDLQGEFLGSDAEFTMISMPPPSHSCLEARPYGEAHCSSDLRERVGLKLSACGDPPQIIQKVINAATYESSHSQDLPEAAHSPSYAALAQYKLSELQMNEILRLFNLNGDPRRAVCDWASQNMEHLEKAIPRDYPRTFVPKQVSAASGMHASATLGGIVTVMVLWAFYMVHKNRKCRAIEYAQIGFLVLLLVGCTLTGLGAIVIGLPSSNWTCVLEKWLLYLGQTLQLVPLIVKVAAVNLITRAGKRMRRIKLQRRFLYSVVTLISMIMVMYLSLWSALDPPSVFPEYESTSTLNELGEKVVWITDVCGSCSHIWNYVGMGWFFILLLCTTVLAIQMRQLNVTVFSETNTLAWLVYTKLVFALAVLFTHILASTEIQETVLSSCRGILFSADTMATICIYFVPKFWAQEDDGGNSQTRVSGLTYTVNSQNGLPYPNTCAPVAHPCPLCNGTSNLIEPCFQAASATDLTEFGETSLPEEDDQGSITPHNPGSVRSQPPRMIRAVSTPSIYNTVRLGLTAVLVDELDQMTMQSDGGDSKRPTSVEEPKDENIARNTARASHHKVPSRETNGLSNVSDDAEDCSSEVPDNERLLFDEKFGISGGEIVTSRGSSVVSEARLLRRLNHQLRQSNESLTTELRQLKEEIATLLMARGEETDELLAQSSGNSNI